MYSEDETSFRQRRGKEKPPKPDGKKFPAKESKENHISEKQRSRKDSSSQNCSGKENPTFSSKSRQIIYTKISGINSPSRQCDGRENPRPTSEMRESNVDYSGKGNSPNQRSGEVKSDQPFGKSIPIKERKQNNVSWKQKCGRESSSQNSSGKEKPRSTNSKRSNQISNTNIHVSGLKSPSQQCNGRDNPRPTIDKRNYQNNDTKNNAKHRLKLLYNNDDDTELIGMKAPNQQCDGRETLVRSSTSEKRNSIAECSGNGNLLNQRIGKKKSQQPIGKNIPIKERKQDNVPGKQKCGKESSSQNCSGKEKPESTNSKRSNQISDTKISGLKSPSQQCDGRDNPRSTIDKRNYQNIDTKNNANHRLSLLYNDDDDTEIVV